MLTRRLHRIAGLVMILPLLGWAVTGFFFFVKPGYGAAYEILQPKTYPIEGSIAIEANPEWLEFRYLRTILGDHLIVRTSKSWSHLDPQTLQPRGLPDGEAIRSLLEDAFTVNPERYGRVVNIDENRITTETGVRIKLNWDRLTLDQRGADTDRIDFLYRIHYLQWTGLPYVDRVLGMLGLALVFVLSVLGARLFFKP